MNKKKIIAEIKEAAAKINQAHEEFNSTFMADNVNRHLHYSGKLLDGVSEFLEKVNKLHKIEVAEILKAKPHLRKKFEQD